MLAADVLECRSIGAFVRASRLPLDLLRSAGAVSLGKGTRVTVSMLIVATMRLIASNGQWRPEMRLADAQGMIQGLRDLAAAAQLNSELFAADATASELMLTEIAECLGEVVTLLESMESTGKALNLIRKTLSAMVRLSLWVSLL